MKKTKMAIAMLITYILLMIGSSYALYTSYTNHADVAYKIEQRLLAENSTLAITFLENRLLEEKIVMSASFLVLILSMFMFNRREYVFKYMDMEEKSLQKLLLEIEEYSEFKNRADNFKERIQDKKYP